MNNEKFSIFIKNLRLEKTLRQGALAEVLYVSRTTSTKWENGKSIPDPDKYELLCKFFNITIEELIASERKSKSNKEEISNSLLRYINDMAKKNKKLTQLTIISLCAIVLLIITFLGTYFFTNYNSIHFYTYNGSSDNYKIQNGLLILSKDKIYLTLGNITPSYEGKITLSTKIDNVEQVIYEGEQFNIINDTYSNSNLINYELFKKGMEELYIIVNNEKIKLNFTKSYSNDKYLYHKNKDILDKRNDNIIVPTPILNNFNCVNKNCTLNTNNTFLSYNYPVFVVASKYKTYTYYIDTKTLEYILYTENENIKCSFSVNNNNYDHEYGECENKEIIYKEFKKNYLFKYGIL